MAWDSAGSSDGYDTGSYPPGPGGASGASWAVIGIAAAVLGVLLVGVAVWIVRLQASAEQVPQVTSLAPQAAAAAPGGGSSSAGGSSPGGTSVSAGSTGTSAAPSSPLDRVDQAWAAKAATATGISDRAFLAYASADLTIEAEQPACGLGWNTLAAIATVESANGTFGGATVLANGYTSKPIVGVPLNGGTFGGQKLAAIPATDGGWQRAVGPFQFIPSTWAKWGADGNGDGVISPDQIDDAALAAARYLCASGPMTTPAGWRAAVFSYNQSDAYVNEVADIANRYAAEATGLS
ncbi:MAG TPA: lytic transglycosylase domain-containing protein [Trebonia sp.]|nr:lytic transglycosylase domain-containing protein [Trebonia sp.]